MSRRALIGAAVVALVLLGACGVKTTAALDGGEGEDDIRSFLQGQVEAPVDAVSCPDREVKAGDVFDCTARVDGQPVRLRVTQEDSEGNVPFELPQAILVIDKAVAAIEQHVRALTGSPVKADCGPARYLVRDPGATLACRVTPTSRGADRRVVLTVKDVEGNVDLRLI